jgi:hypothetical protein
MVRIQGVYHATWIFVPVSAETIASLLPTHYGALTQVKENLDGHYMWFELGQEIDCGPACGSLLRCTFMEAKCNIPFVKFPNDDSKLFNFKGLVVMDHYVNTWGSQLAYGLQSVYTKVDASGSHYKFEINQKPFSIEFQVNKVFIILETAESHHSFSHKELFVH